MPSSVLATLYRYELRMLLRDTRTIVIAVVAPLVLFPVLILVTRWVEQRQVTRVERTVYRYAVTGSNEDFAYYKVVGVINREAFDPDTARAPAAFLHDRGLNPDSLIRAGAIHLVVEGLGADEYRRIRTRELLESGSADSTEFAAIADLPDVPVIRLHYRADQDVSRAAFERMRERLEELQQSHRDSVYRAHGLVIGVEDVGEVGSENMASREQEGGALLGLILTPLLLVLMLTGGSIVAVDAISGEKERGTLETLLTTAARRVEIVSAKQLAVATVGVAVTLVNLANLLAYVVLGLITPPESFAVSLSPVSLLVLLVLFLPVTVLVSSSLLLLSGWSKSYKEYQLYFPFLMLVFLALAASAALPGMDLRSAIALVPVVGVGVAVREVMIGELDWPFLAVALASTGVAAWSAARITASSLSTERLISAAELDRADLAGGPALFPRRVLRWFGVLWAILLVTSLWTGESLELRQQVLVNIVGLLFVGSLLMVRGYRLDPRTAFALRSPPPAAWPAVLVGAPAGLATGLGLLELFRWFVPVPEEVMRSFGQFLATADLPVWQIALFLAVIPGVVEELAFRGVLVHGLASRLRPVPLALTVGLVFGLFHLSVWRIVPTAYLGVLLTAVVLLTGSVYPAMLWHAVHNALGILPMEMGWVREDFGLPLWSYPLSATTLGIAFLVLWNVRRPYPGLLAGAGRRSTSRPPGSNS